MYDINDYGDFNGAPWCDDEIEESFFDSDEDYDNDEFDED